jgi:ABC-type antimicrobial peptide transport system permease subunit
MIRRVIWLLVALLALGIVGLMIVTPTPPKPGQAPPLGIPAHGAVGGNGQVPRTH